MSRDGGDSGEITTQFTLLHSPPPTPQLTSTLICLEIPLVSLPPLSTTHTTAGTADQVTSILICCLCLISTRTQDHPSHGEMVRGGTHGQWSDSSSQNIPCMQCIHGPHSRSAALHTDNISTRHSLGRSYTLRDCIGVRYEELWL